MALEVIMPKPALIWQKDRLFNGIKSWRLKEGEILLEIMTDKVSMELEAEDGYLIAILKKG